MLGCASILSLAESFNLVSNVLIFISSQGVLQGVALRNI